MENEIIKIEDLRKTYLIGDIQVHAINGIDLKVYEGEFLAIMGASGSGKSTLMNLLGCLDSPTSGNYYLDGVDTGNLTPNEYADIRNEKIGFVFQGFNLLSRTNALENVVLPLLYDRKTKIKNPTKKAVEVLEKVGLGDRLNHLPNQLSGGQQQRVAIARALVNNPSILLADEPTGNLDSKTSIEVFSTFQDLNEQGITVILVTHERDFAQFAKRIIKLKDGVIMNDFDVKDRVIAKEIEYIDELSD